MLPPRPPGGFHPVDCDSRALTHFPKVGNLNEIHTTAMFLTFPLR